MITLHFTAKKYGDDEPRYHLASDEQGRSYVIVQPNRGLYATVFDADNNLIHTVDWLDHAVHIDEMRKHLQDWANQTEAVAS